MQGKRIQFKAAEEQPVLRLKEFRGEIKFAEGVKEVSDVQILRAGVFAHPYYGAMIINQQTLADLVRNFNDRVRRQDIPIDYFHDSDREAAGWFTELRVENGGTELWGKAKWTPRAQQMLADGEVKYFSADFYFEWTDPETGVTYKNVLNGGGLVNRPFVKDMKPVVELSEGDQMKTVEQLQAELKTLGESKDAEIKKLGETIASKDAEISKLKAEAAKTAKEKEDAEHLAKFEELCREGKACAAQKEAWVAKDFVKFAELAQKLNTVENGGAEGDKKGASKLSDSDKAACKALGISEEDFLKYNA
jgi:phage I-like protein